MSHTLEQIVYLLLGTALLLGSGIGIVGMIPPLRRALTRVEVVSAGLLLSSGVAGVWGLVGRILSIGISAWSIALLAVSILLLAAGGILTRRDRSPRSVEPPSRAHSGALVALAAIAFLLMVRDGGSLGPVHDSLDFVAFVRESLETGDIAPASPIYRADPGVPPDPRRGSFHTQIAALCYLSRVDPTEAWKWLPRLLAPLAVLGIGAMLRPWLGGGTAAVATAFFIATTFFSYDRLIQNLGYASRFGWVCGWAGLMALGQGLAFRARRRAEEARALFALAAASPAILLFVHLLSGFQVLLALGCAGLAAVARRGCASADRRALLGTLAGATAFLVPVVLWRLSHTTQVANPLFDHRYGVLLLAENWPVLHPDYLADRFGIAGIWGAALGLALLWRARVSAAAGFLAISTAVPLLILFFPPIVKIVLAANAHSMLIRVILTIPFAGTLAWFAVKGTEAFLEGSATRRSLGAGAVALVAAVLAAQTIATRSEWLVPERLRATHKEDQALVRALDFLERGYPNTVTVLSDPISSYAIPAYTRHHAVAPFHQHSSPADPSVPARIRDVQAALNGRVGMRRTFDVIRRYEVDLIVVNQSYARLFRAYYVFLSPLAYPEQRAKFEGRPDLFHPVYNTNDVLIYEVRDPGSDRELPGDPPNPDRIEDPGGDPLVEAGPIDLLAFRADPGPHLAGEPIRFDLIWRRTDLPYHLPIACDIKIQHAEMPRSYETPIFGRLIRWRDERRTGEIQRFGRPFRPLDTFYPDFLWGEGEAYRDEHWESTPPHARQGTYQVWVRVFEEPYERVDRLQEYWSNQLGPDWRLMGTVEIRR